MPLVISPVGFAEGGAIPAKVQASWKGRRPMGSAPPVQSKVKTIQAQQGTPALAGARQAPPLLLQTSRLERCFVLKAGASRGRVLNGKRGVTIAEAQVTATFQVK